MSVDQAARPGKLERRLFILAACAGTVAMVFALVAASGGSAAATVLTMLR
ncbi:MAG: hypothetical protein R3B49_11165 [Phycisphaerales bacterium]